jgi:serine/threonine protein kinase
MTELREPVVFPGTFGTYTAHRQHRAGGTGIVYEGTDDEQKPVAIKLLQRPNSTHRSRFRQEISFCLRDHPGIVKVLDHGSTGGKRNDGLFYVMPFYRMSLRDVMNGGVPQKNVLRYFSHLLSSTEYAHRQGVVHRDLKPENILVDESKDELLLADFGIAHFAEPLLVTAIETQDKEKLANFVYASPEQRDLQRRTPIDHRSDIFSLGLILNELFTGHVPQGRGFRTIAAVASDFGFLDSVVDLMIENEPERRPASADAVRLEILAREKSAEAAQAAAALAVPPVAPALSDPLLSNPPQIVDVDYQDGELIIFLAPRINARWLQSWQLFHWSGAIGGTTPQHWRWSISEMRWKGAGSFRDLSAGNIQVTENDVQKVIEQTKEWLPRVLDHYRKGVEREAEQARQTEVADLKRQRESQEQRERVLKTIRF